MQEQFKDPPHPHPPVKDDRSAGENHTRADNRTTPTKLGAMRDPADPSSSPNAMVDDKIPTDGAKEVADSSLPDTPAEPDDQTKNERRDDIATRGPTKPTSTEEGLPTNRKDSRRHVGKVAQMGNFQEPEVGAVTKDAIPVSKQGIKLNRQISYASEASYRSRVSNGVEGIQPLSEERDMATAQAGKCGKVQSREKPPTRATRKKKISMTHGGKSGLASSTAGIEPRFPPG